MRKLLILSCLVALLLAIAAGLAVRESPEARWRLEVVVLKLQGKLGDLSWPELFRWLQPGSPVYLEGVAKTGNAYQGIVSLYTSAADAKQGEAIFRERCAMCHGVGAKGDKAPSLLEPRHGSSDWALFRNITRGVEGTGMAPQDLGERDVWQVVAFLRSVAAGEAGADANRPLQAKSAAVPFERLVRAREDPSNWLTYSGSFDSQRHSSLQAIDRSNAWRLRLEWILQLPTSEELVETSPLVVDRVMYLTEPPASVHAVDAATGQLFWSYRRALPEGLAACCGLVNRGIAILDDKLYMATLDAHLVALDSRNGQVVWDVEVADHRKGYSITAAPLALDGTIVTGIAGGEYGIRGFLDAYDAATGERAWRFHTIPGPGEQGHDSWEGDSWKTGGAPTWLTGSFDPDLDLIYWGVGNPGPVFVGDDRRGDNLFSNSVVALDAATGKLRWHFQFTPHDDHDWDAAQIPVLVDGTFQGTPRKLMLWANRNAFYYVLDRETGEFLTAVSFARQTWAERIESNGAPVRLPDSSPSEKGTLVWPGAAGATNWWSPSFSPLTGMFYIPVLEKASIYFKGDVVFSPGELFVGSAGQPVSGEPHYAAVRAVDASTGALQWEHRFPANERSFSRMGGILSVAGGVVFAGEWKTFYALDSETGAVLWSIPTGAPIVAAPVTFEVDGKQMVAVAAGRSVLTFGLTPERAPEANARELPSSD